MSQNMRRFFLVVLFALVLFSSVRAEAPKSVEELLTSVAREVRKNDVWVESVVQADYTTGASSKPVQIRFTSLKEGQEASSMGLHGHYAAYSPIEDVLLLPLSVKPEEMVDAIDHELFHVLYDDEGKYKSLIHQKGFHGPTDKRIAQYTRRKVNSPAFVALRNRLKDAQENQELGRRFRAAVLRCMTAIKTATENYKEAVKDVGNKADIADLMPFIKPAVLKGYRSRLKDLRSSILPIATGMKEFNTELNKHRIAKSASPESVRSWTAKIEPLAKKAQILAKRSVAIQVAVKKTLEQGESRRALAEIRDLDRRIKEATDPKIKAMLSKDKDSILDSRRRDKEVLNTLKELAALGNKMDGFGGMLQEAMGVLVTSTNVEKIAEITDSPNEVMARVVDSAYSLYYGAVDQNKYPLDLNDLKFLESFTYEGRPLFRKAVEKYRLGITMIAEGIKVEEVKAKLEYAIEFVYKGKTYSWSESCFAIKGVPPYREIPEPPKEGGKGK